MAQKTNLNVSPYFDDFDKSKNFQNVLFRPGFSVQARELSQIQSIIGNKIENVADYLFKDGAMVIPGQVSLEKGLFAVRVQTTFNGEVVDLSKYINATTPVTITGVTSGVKAQVHGYQTATSTSPAKLNIHFVGGGENELQGSTKQFTIGEELKANVEITHVSGGQTYAAGVSSLTCETGEQIKLLTATPSVSGPQVSANIQAGVYYIRGTFVEVAEETLTLTDRSNFFSGRIGLKITEEIVTPEGDLTLTDNATGSSNYAAKGAHRLKISASLASKTLDTTDDADFVELMRIENNQILTAVKNTEMGAIEETFARRTHDESGNYTVNPFQFSVNESVDLNENKGIYETGVRTHDGNLSSTALLSLKVSPGKAYIKGFEVNQIGPVLKDIKKARDVNSVNAGVSAFEIGNYVTVDNVYGSPDIDFVSGETEAYKICLLYDTATTTRGSASGTLIGAARVRSMQYQSGVAGTVTAQHKLFLFDIRRLLNI